MSDEGIVELEVWGLSPPGTLVFRAVCGGKEVITDEPRSMGGEGTAPTPLETFLASLAACFSTTLKIHARRMGVDVGYVRARARAKFDMLGFLGIEGHESGIKHIELRVCIESSSPCRELDKVIELTKRTWVVGSTIARLGILDLVIEKRCAE